MAGRAGRTRARECQSGGRLAFAQLADIEVNLADYEGTPGWPACHVTSCGPDCAKPVAVFGEQYRACPYVMRSAPLWQYIVRLYIQAQISPLCDWPTAYLPWVQNGMMRLEEAKATRMAGLANRGN